MNDRSKTCLLPVFICLLVLLLSLWPEIHRLQHPNRLPAAALNAINVDANAVLYSIDPGWRDKLISPNTPTLYDYPVLGTCPLPNVRVRMQLVNVLDQEVAPGPEKIRFPRACLNHVMLCGEVMAATLMKF